MKVIGQLGSLEMKSFDFEFNENGYLQMPDFCKLASSLPKSSYLKVYFDISPLRPSATVFDVLKYWLRVSNEAARCVKLCLEYNCQNSIERTNEAIQALLKTELFAGLSVGIVSNRTILKFQNAVIVLSIAVQSSKCCYIITVW
jgi:hypothetical protein